MPGKGKQPCPHCGREFERLWQHRCSAAVRPPAAADVAEGASSSGKKASAKPKEKQPCPHCGREFERLWQHRCSAGPRPSAGAANNPSVPRNEPSTDTRKKQPCPTCGREFERLWQHKCPLGSTDTAENDSVTGNETSSDTKKKQPCPTCGKEFVRLWQHKCHAADSHSSREDSDYGSLLNDTAPVSEASGFNWGSAVGNPHGFAELANSNRVAGNETGRNAKEKQPCPTCGKEFVRLWQHKCPFGSTDRAEYDSVTGNETSGNAKEKQPCPTCGKEFVRLWQHKCPFGSTDRAEYDSVTGNETSGNAKEKQPCPTCGKEFVRLWQHKCPFGSTDRAENDSVTGNETSGNAKEKQPCPTCGKEFVRLWQHKCHAADSYSSREDSDYGSLLNDTAPVSEASGFIWGSAVGNPHGSAELANSNRVTGNETGRNARDKQPCPTCGKEFVRLWQHKCPFGSTDRAEYDSVTGNETSGNAKEKQPCPTCGKEFVRLWQHKCHAADSYSSREDSDYGSLLNDTAPVSEASGFIWGSAVGNPHGSAELANSNRVTGNETGRNARDKQPCPTCGKEFVRLWQHKCHAADSHSSREDSDYGSLLNGAAPAPEADRSTWGGAAAWNSSAEWFDEELDRPQLDEDTPTQPSPWSTERGYGGARPKVASSEQDKVCKSCGKSFKRLYQHICKAVSMPPPPPASSSQPPAPPADQDCWGNRPVIDVAALEEKAQRVMDSLHLPPSSDPTGEAITFFDDEVKLLKKESHTVFHATGRFRDKIRGRLEESTGLRWDVLNSGSSFDGTKVARADEVDCMFVPHLPAHWLQMTCDGAPPGFGYLQLTSPVSPEDPHGELLLGLLDEQGRLSSQRFREKVFGILKGAVEDERRAEVDPNANPDSPSYAVLLKAIPRKTADGGSGLDAVSMDLVPALKLDKLPPVCDQNLCRLSTQDAEVIRKAGFHVIPKKCPDVHYQHVDHLLWRFSFSCAEKHLTKFADSKQRNAMTQEDQDAPTSPTCRKLVLRILKRLLEIFKGLDNSRTANPKMRQLRTAVEFLKRDGGFHDLKVEKFTTFQIRTLIWTEIYITCPDPVQWDRKCRRTRLIHSLMQLKKMVSGRMQVSHFFVPDMDIMALVPQREREFLYIMFHIAKELF